MDLKSISTKELVLELATRKGIVDILEVSGNQEFKIKIGANEYLYEGPLNIIVVDKNQG